MKKRPKIERILSKEEREERIKRRAKMSPERLKRINQRRQAKVIEHKITLVAYITATDGEVIKIGPFKKREIVIRHRFIAIRLLIKQGRARPIDILCLQLYEQGYFDEEE